MSISEVCGPSKGSQRYAIPAGVNLKDYQSVIIWCERFGVLISAADLMTSCGGQVNRCNHVLAIDLPIWRDLAECIQGVGGKARAT